MFISQCSKLSVQKTVHKSRNQCPENSVLKSRSQCPEYSQEIISVQKSCRSQCPKVIQKSVSRSHPEVSPEVSIQKSVSGSHSEVIQKSVSRSQSIIQKPVCLQWEWQVAWLAPVPSVTVSWSDWANDRPHFPPAGPRLGTAGPGQVGPWPCPRTAGALGQGAEQHMAAV